MFCKNCGSKIEDGSKFCTNCGTVISFEMAKQENATPKQEGEKDEKSICWKKPKIAIWTLIGLGCFCIILGLIGLVISDELSSSVGCIVIGLPFCVLAVILYLKKIIKYGWGVGIAVLLALIGILNGCGKTYVCIKCDKTTSEIYYDIDGDESLCKDCAKKYWVPFDYKKYKAR